MAVHMAGLRVRQDETSNSGKEDEQMELSLKNIVFVIFLYASYIDLNNNSYDFTGLKVA